MSHDYERAALGILKWFHRAEDELVSKAVVTFNGEAGTVLELRLDEHHGICFTMDKCATGFALQYEGPSQRWYPVSTIKDKAP